MPLPRFRGVRGDGRVPDVEGAGPQVHAAAVVCHRVVAGHDRVLGLKEAGPHVEAATDSPAVLLTVALWAFEAAAETHVDGRRRRSPLRCRRRSCPPLGGRRPRRRRTTASRGVAGKGRVVSSQAAPRPDAPPSSVASLPVRSCSALPRRLQREDAPPSSPLLLAKTMFSNVRAPNRCQIPPV